MFHEKNVAGVRSVLPYWGVLAYSAVGFEISADSAGCTGRCRCNRFPASFSESALKFLSASASAAAAAAAAAAVSALAGVRVGVSYSPAPAGAAAGEVEVVRAQFLGEHL